MDDWKISLIFPLTRVAQQGIKMKWIPVPIKDRLRKKCPYSTLFWYAFSRIRTEYGVQSKYSVQMRENSDQNNSEYGHFLCTDKQILTYLKKSG